MTVVIKIQWNFDLTKAKGLKKFIHYKRGFVVSRFFSMYFTITGVNKIICYTEDFVRGFTDRNYLFFLLKLLDVIF